MLSRLRFAPALLLLTTSLALAQTTLHVVPIPADALEMVTGRSKVVDDAQERATVFELLERARQNAMLQTGGSAPYTMKVSFEAAGDVQYTGSGTMQETWRSASNWRWTAQLGGYTQTRLLAEGRTHDLRSNDFVPMRVQMVRDALLWPMWFSPRALARVAPARLGDSEVLCGLFSRPSNDPALMSSEPGRRWVETEFCMEPRSSLLRVDSSAPGIYTLYDYSDAIAFHGHTIPRSVTVTEEGRTVLTIHVDSISAPTEQELALLKPSGQLQTAGSLPGLGGPYRIPQYAPAPQIAGQNSMVRPIIVHAIVGQDGRVLDAEALQHYDPGLTQAALDLVRRSTYPPQGGEFGFAQREYFINVKFLPPAASK